VIREARLAEDVGQLEIRPEARTKILKRCILKPVMIYERGSRNPRCSGALAFSLRYSA
jgi:hypothetical protein